VSFGYFDFYIFKSDQMRFL